MNLQHVVTRKFDDTDHDYDQRDTLLYALSLGLGSDPLDSDELPYVYEGLARRPLQVVPTQAVILGWQPFWHDEPASAIDWKRIVHGEQHVCLHAPLATAARVRAKHRLVGVQDKGAGRGAVLQVDTELFDRVRGTHLASLSSLQFLRGDGGCGSWDAGMTPAIAPPMTPVTTPVWTPARTPATSPVLAPIADDAPPVASIDLRTSPQAALLYRAASRDWMPIHADPGVAREAGFERPISHGLNNLGLACRAILKICAPGRPERLRAIAVRFVQPGLPGDTVRVELFDGGAGRLQFRATAVERGVRLLDRGSCTLEA